MNARAARQMHPVSWDCIDSRHLRCRDGGEDGWPRSCACDCHQLITVANAWHW